MSVQTLTGLSSMATRALLADLAASGAVDSMPALRFESAGGVEVARRIREGETVDVVVLAQGAVDGLAGDGHLDPATVRPLFGSEVVVAVAAGAEAPDVASSEALQEALRGAGRVGYSTGPSGDALLSLLDGWGMRDELADRLVQARAGVPVARLLADGEADLGFQQRSELEGADGVQVLGPMPPGSEIRTIFTGAVHAHSAHADAAEAAVAAMASDQAAEIAARHGFTPVR